MDSIVEFRDQYKVECKNFLDRYSEFQDEISSKTSKIVKKDTIFDQLDSLEEGIKEYKNSCSYFKADSFFGVRVVTIPTILTVAENWISVNPEIKGILMAAGLAFGGLWGLMTSDRNIEKINKTNPYSYLVSLDKYDFDTVNRFNSNLSYDIKEFIED